MSINMMFKDKKFYPIMWTQFFGALNDNVLKNALVVLIAFKGIELWGLKSESLVSLATLIFILPFFLFSALAGQVADKFEKSKLIRIIKVAEIGIMILAGFGFYYAYYPLLFCALFLMGLHSTFFGPVKYSALPELVTVDKLTSANAYVEVGTFIAILIGTIAGGHLIAIENGALVIISILILVAILGLVTSQQIVKIKTAAPDLKLQLNPITPTLQTLRASFKNKAVFNSILGISWFWFLGAVILSLLPTVTTQILNGNEDVVTIFLATFTIGIACGAVICEKLSFERVEIGLVPFGSLGMTVFLVDLATVLAGWNTSVSKIDTIQFLNSIGAYRLLCDLFAIAIFGGMFTVPLYTLVQQRSDSAQRSRIIGANNIMNSLFMVIGSALLMWFLQIKISLPQIMLIYACFNLIIAVYIYTLVPEFTLRFLAWILARMLYRLDYHGQSSIPKEGPAILVCNHVSYIDWLIIAAAIKRPIHFVMYYKFAGIPLLRYLMRHAGVIPIAGKNEDEKIFNRSFEKIAMSLAAGELVCIFPEGGLTKDGNLQEFKKGIEHILKQNPVPVVPMALKGLWGSVFSNFVSKGIIRRQRKFWFPVKLQVGNAIAPEKVTAVYLESQVLSLLK